MKFLIVLRLHMIVLIMCSAVLPTNAQTNMDTTLIDHIEPVSADAPVMVLFGGNPDQRDRVLRNLVTLGDLGAYGALSEEEGYALLEEHADRVKLVLIGGRYSREQRVRIKAWCAQRLPHVQITEPGVDYPYDHEEVKRAVKAKMGL